VKIILLIGSDDDTKKIAVEFGASFYFEKPVISSTIFGAIRKLEITK
jgi:hypothetical protein